MKNIAFSSMFVAISVLICILASFFSTMSLTITAITGVVSAIAVVQCGYKYAGIMYAASSVLIFLLVPNRECAVYYILFFGHYPIVRVFLERIKNKLCRRTIKLAIGNLIFALSMWILLNIVGLEEVFGKTELLVLVILFNGAFVLYEILLDRIISAYIGKRIGKNGFR